MVATELESSSKTKLITANDDRKYDSLDSAERGKAAPGLEGRDDSDGKEFSQVSLSVSEATTGRTLTNTMAFIHLFKIFTGPSTLGTPKIMENGGLLLGPVAFVSLAYLNVWCNITVVKSARILCQRLGRNAMSYEEVVEQSFLRNTQSKAIQRLAPYTRPFTKFLLCLTQFGVLAFFIKTIATTADKHLKTAISDYTYPLMVTEAFVCLLLIPYSMMKNLKVLYYFSLAASILTLVSIVTIVQYSCSTLRPVSEFPLVTPDPLTLPLLVGATLFTVEGVPMILPIENKTKNPKDFGGMCGIVTLASTCNIVVNVMVGFYGYMSAGESVPDNIFRYLPSQVFYDIVSIAYAVSVFLTYTIQLYLPAEILGSIVKSKFQASFLQDNADWLSRIVLVISSYLFAAFVPDSDLLMSLIGAFSMALIVFVFPPLAELCVLSGEPGGIPWYTWVKDITIFVFGIIAFFTGTYTSVTGIIRAL